MMQATVIDLLSEKGKFSTEQSVVLAEAIDMTIEKAQLVTVPILDARLAEVNTRIDAVNTRIDGVNARIDRLEARVDGGFASVNAGFASVNARFEMIEAKLAAMEAKMERWAVRLVFTMVLSQTALGPIGAGALDAIRRVLATLVH